MTRTRVISAATIAGLLLGGPVLGGGVAVAEDDPTPAPSPATQPDATVEGGNRPPSTAPDEASVEAGASVTVDVLANDTDDGLPDDGDPALEVVAVRGGDGRFTFTPRDVTFHAEAGDGGQFVGEYDVSDGEAVSTEQVTVLVTAAPDRSVSISLADRPVALRKYRISGRVRPAGEPVEVRVQRRTRQGWVGYREDLADNAGRYHVGFRTARPGEKRFRAVAVYPSGARERSRTITRTVRALADARVSGPLTRKQVPHSWRSGCPVPPKQLRRIRINRWSYQKLVARGSIIVRAREAGDVVRVLRTSFNKRFPIRRMKQANAYYAGGRRTPMESDKAAMRAGNTSAFNCRPVTGNPYRISQHSYGNAVDINTIENPYVTGGRVYPKGSRSYLDRSPYRRGMIVRGGVVAGRMRSLGWLWGARWSHPDYQHFSSNGG